MPTGYTAMITAGDGVSFETFVMRCARAMGACVTMRDAGSDAEIPEAFEPSEWYQGQLDKAEARVVELEGMDEVEAQRRAGLEYEKALAERERSRRETHQKKLRYFAMLESVKCWKPPSADHQGLKEFMVQQIEESIDFDCDESYYAGHPVKREQGEAWRRRWLEAALDDTARYRLQRDEEIGCVAGRNKWLRELRESLGIKTKVTGSEVAK